MVSLESTQFQPNRTTAAPKFRRGGRATVSDPVAVC
jgi:hypothetical protein